VAKSDWEILEVRKLIEEDSLEVGDGYRAKNAEMGKNGLPFMRISNITKNGFNFSGIDILDETNLRKVGTKISQDGDVVFTTKGTVGRFAYVKSDTPKFVYSPQVSYWRVKNRDILDSRFLLYWLQGPEFTNQVFQVKGLTDMADYVNLRDQRRMRIFAPPLDTQRKIAAVLSAYDDLIENNTRRIQILEEMAQAIYRQWFVEFKYPGHETIPLVDSGTEFGEIPQGWEVKKLGDVIELAYGKGLRKAERAGGPIPVYGSSGVVGYHNEALVEGPGIIVGRKGNVGSVFWCDTDFYPIDTTYFVRTVLSLHYVYYNLRHQNFLNNDAAVPGLSRNQAILLPFVVPSQELLEQFEKINSLLFAQILVVRSILNPKSKIWYPHGHERRKRKW
jgi:type I restriction enzyme, S subunit